MNQIRNYILSRYDDDKVNIVKKAEYTLIYLGLLYAWAFVTCVYKIFNFGFIPLAYMPMIIFTCLFTMILFIIYKGKLALALNIFIITGIARLVFLLKDIDNFEFYIMLIINLLVTAFVYIEKYQLFSTYILYFALVIVKAVQYYQHALMGDIDFNMVHFGVYAAIGVLVYIVMIQHLTSIISDDIEKSVILEHLVNRDFLTGVYNRRKFDDYTNKVTVSDAPMSLILFDIDFFKTVNDNFGHKIGDVILISIAEITRREIRSTDELFRWGGEEFIIVLKQTNLQDASMVAEKLRAIFECHTFDCISGKITISYGVAELQTNETFEQLVSRADNALYKAKVNGRNRVEAI